MIARTWHGVTPIAKADEYLRLMRAIAVPDYQAIPGNRGVYVMRRIEGESPIFCCSRCGTPGRHSPVRRGEMEKAKYYDFDADYLLELEPTATHYEVFDSPRNA